METPFSSVKYLYDTYAVGEVVQENFTKDYSTAGADASHGTLPGCKKEE